MASRRFATTVEGGINPRYISLLLWSTIILGVVLRLTQLPTRTVYLDETYTQMRSSGHTAKEMTAELYDGRQRSVETFRTYAQVHGKPSAAALISSYIKEDTQHPPLFYLTELEFVRFFGNSLLSWRLLPALYGVAAIAAAFFLGRSLFPAKDAGLFTAALFAVAPIQRIYSDQAREYSLLVVLLLTATLALVSAVRSGSRIKWLWYSVLVAAGLYTNPTMAYAIAAHVCYVAIVSFNDRRWDNVRNCALALTLALVAYAPWIDQMIVHRNDMLSNNEWSSTHWPFARLAAKWAFNAGATFFDLEYVNIRYAIVAALVLVVALWAIIEGIRSADVRTRILIGTGIIVPLLLLIGPDLLFAEHRSSVARYEFPIIVMLTVAAGGGLARRRLAAIVLIGAGIAASVVGSLHPSWWDNDSDADDARIAAIINGTPRAQVISTALPIYFLVFARVLEPDVRVSLAGDLRNAQYVRHEPLFVLRPTADELRQLQASSGMRFAPVPFDHAFTAHDFGRDLTAAGQQGPPADLYRADDGS